MSELQSAARQQDRQSLYCGRVGNSNLWVWYYIDFTGSGSAIIKEVQVSAMRFYV